MEGNYFVLTGLYFGTSWIYEGVLLYSVKRIIWSLAVYIHLKENLPVVNINFFIPEFPI